MRRCHRKRPQTFELKLPCGGATSATWGPTKCCIYSQPWKDSWGHQVAQAPTCHGHSHVSPPRWHKGGLESPEGRGRRGEAANSLRRASHKAVATREKLNLRPTKPFITSPCGSNPPVCWSLGHQPEGKSGLSSPKASLGIKLGMQAVYLGDDPRKGQQGNGGRERKGGSYGRLHCVERAATVDSGLNPLGAWRWCPIPTAGDKGAEVALPITGWG